MAPFGAHNGAQSAENSRTSSNGRFVAQFESGALMFDLPGRTPGNQPVELVWRATWEDKNDDFVAFDRGADVGRIYSNSTMADGHFWSWFAWVPGAPNSGKEPSRREAMLAIEERYNAWRATQPPVDPRA